MTDFEAVVQRYYGDRPVMKRIDDALRAAGGWGARFMGNF